MKLKILLNCAVAALLIALTADYGGKPLLDIVATLERATVDWRLTRQPPRKNSDIVIVEIDRDSLKSVGSWPWSRDKMAALIDQMFRLRVRAAAFTFPFSGPDDKGLEIFDRIQSIAGDSVPPEQRERFDYDQRFAEAISGRPVFLGYAFDDSARVGGFLPPSVELYVTDGGAVRPAPPKAMAPAAGWNFYRGYSANLKDFRDAGEGSGFVGASADEDGFVRRMPVLARHARRIYESLGLALLRRNETPGNVLPIYVSGQGSIDALFVGRRRIPIDRAGEMHLNFLGPGGRTADYDNMPEAVFRHVSAAEVIDGAVPAALLRDKIALVGLSEEAQGAVYATPVNSAMSAAELMATQIANMRDGDALHHLPAADAAVLAGLVVVALAAAAAFVALGPLLSMAAAVALCALSAYIALLFWDAGVVVNFVAPMLVFIGLMIFNSVAGFFFEWRAGRDLRSAFGQYVPPELAKRIGERQSVILGGESRTISVLFSDVRNFTAISENFTPRDLTRMMNRMLTVLSEAVHRHGGTVDKFIGDAVMAFWNAPLDDPDHAANAVRSAVAMQEGMRKLSAELEAEGRPPMRMGIGICSGEASVGNMGSNLRMAYTAMGDTVNVASRIEGLTKYYEVDVLAAESTVAMCGKLGQFFRVVDVVRVKGRAQALSVCEPLGDANLLPPPRRASLELFEEMRQCYMRGEFDAAAAKIAEYRLRNPEDGLAKMYESRLDVLLRDPPAVWDGVTNFETK